VVDYLRRSGEFREQRLVTPTLKAQSIIGYRKADAFAEVTPRGLFKIWPWLRYRGVVHQELVFCHYDRRVDSAEIIEAPGWAWLAHGVSRVFLPSSSVEIFYWAGE
jgi:hypothetical protein